MVAFSEMRVMRSSYSSSKKGMKSRLRKRISGLDILLFFLLFSCCVVGCYCQSMLSERVKYGLSGSRLIEG